VRTGACRLTLQIDRMTADVLTGRSDVYGGEVRLRRGYIQEIRFTSDKPSGVGP
jgi:hypothetical protein